MRDDGNHGGFRAHAGGSDVATIGALGTFAEWQVYDQISLVKVDKSLPLNTICLVACGVIDFIRAGTSTT